MKWMLSLSFLVLSASALADATGGNSSGGDEPFGAGSIPFEAPRARVAGVVSQVTPGQNGSPWRVKFVRTVIGNAVEADLDTPRNPASQPKAGCLLFLRGTEPYTVGRVISPSTTEIETSVTDYLKDSTPRARIDWAAARLSSTSAYVKWSAQYELEKQARGPLKNEVLTILVDHPELLRDGSLTIHTVAGFFPDPKALAAVKAVALDGTLPNHVRYTAVSALLFGKDGKAQAELWKDGKDGADAWLQDQAKRIWETLNAPRP